MIVGREKEISSLRKAYESGKPEFVAVYGRRRVGKTFLIRETFGNKFFFYYSGRYNVSSRTQMASFYEALQAYGMPRSAKPRSWGEMFNLLKSHISSSRKARKVIFLDELPWICTPGSDFLSCLEYFWNSWASARKDVFLIICGSASSWIVNNIFKNKGGLHNRITLKIPLKPFSLHEVGMLMKHYRCGYSKNNILEGYMALGGIPFYWSKFDNEKSVAQNLNDLFIAEDGEFRYEYRELYDSLFNRPEKYKAVIEALATRKKGLTREEIIRFSGLKNNGNLTRVIEDLIECGFIRKYCDYGRKVKDALFQLIDFYTLFYFEFIHNQTGNDDRRWLMLQTSNAYHTWSGLAFEKVCLVHTAQIKKAMGIEGIIANIYSWHSKKDDEGQRVQIDLIFERGDRVFSLFEIKYAPEGYRLTAKEEENIRRRRRAFREFVGDNKGIQTVLITSNGLVNKRCVSDVNVFLTADNLMES